MPYLAEARRFLHHLDRRRQSLATLTREELTAYLAAPPRAPATQRRVLTVLQQFLAQARHPLAAELATLRRPRPRPAAPDYLSEVEEKALRKALKTRTDIPGQARDRALFCLLLDTGLRVGEAAALTVGDVDLDGKRLRLVGKGGKIRQRFLPVETRDLLKGLVSGRPLTAPLFVSARGRGLTDRHMRRLLTAWGARAGILRRLHPHLLRHTFATSLLKQTGNLRLVQVALDHESPTTTAIYAHVADEELRAAIEGRRSGS
jgi:site-specific recombinase XerD